MVNLHWAIYISNTPSKQNALTSKEHVPRRKYTEDNNEVKVLRGLNYEEILQALKLQPLEKNNLVLTYKILNNHIELEAAQLLTFFRRPGLRRSSFRLLHQTGRTRNRRNSFACTIVIFWSR